MSHDPHRAPHGFHTYHCSDCGYQVPVPIHCCSKSCQPCLDARRWRIVRRIQWALSMKPSNDSHRWRHTTLTIKNTHDLPERLDHLVASFRKLRQRKTWKSTQFFGFYVIQITKSDSGWHPHLHIVTWGRWLPRGRILHEWMQITNDSRGVYITKIKQGTCISAYVTRYITIPEVHTAQDSHHVDEVTKNRRLFGPIGAAAQYLRECKPPKVLLPCPRCGRVEWIPEFLLHMYENRAQYLYGKGHPVPTIHQGRDP